jgi:putative transcriptional regulator
MNDENFKGMVAGLEDAIGFMRGDKSRATVHHAVDIKAIRKAVGETQEQFAATDHISRGTLRDWEQARRVQTLQLVPCLPSIPWTLSRLSDYWRTLFDGPYG